MSLQEPTKKMSKTGDDGIALSDDADTVRGKLKRAVTDSGSEITFDEQAKPAISNLLTIYSALANRGIGELQADYDGVGYAKFKADLAEVVVGFLEPFQTRRAALASNPDEVSRILNASEEKARMLASTTLINVKERMGLK